MKKVVTFGEVMMRLSPPNHSRFIQANSFDITYGGGEANVAISLAQLGIPAAHATCFPANDLGKSATAFLKKFNVNTDHIVHDGDRIGLYFLEKGSAMRASKIVYDRADSAFSKLKPENFNWEEILKEAQWFHWTGITPAISAEAAQACLEALKTAKKLGITISADVNYRKNLWKYGKTVQEVMPGLVDFCDIIVCNENDASDIFTIFPDSEEDKFTSVCKQVMKRFPKIKKIITTKRKTVSASHNKLSAVLWDGKEKYKTLKHDINPIVDRIGGGDAFIAGFIYGQIIYQNDQKAIDFGIAASALKHTIEYDANLSSVEEIENVMSGEAVGRLIR